MIINIHGGPEGQTVPSFQGRNSYYMNELGVAMIYPNVRGSTGFGKTLAKRDNGTRRLDSVRDIESLLDWIATRPELDASKALITGGSYGGTALTNVAGMLTTPHGPARGSATAGTLVASDWTHGNTRIASEAQMNHINSFLLAAVITNPWTAAPAMAGGDSVEAAPGPLASAPLSLSASLGARILTVRSGDSVVATYAVSVGADGHATPTGTFQIRKLIWNPRWVPPKQPWARGKTAKAPGDPDNPMQTVKIFFKEPDYYIHGTPAVASLGEAASKGCLRMDPREIAGLARWVMEHGGEPRPPSWFERIRRLARREHIVRLSTPVRLTIEP